MQIMTPADWLTTQMTGRTVRWDGDEWTVVSYGTKAASLRNRSTGETVAHIPLSAILAVKPEASR